MLKLIGYSFWAVLWKKGLMLDLLDRFQRGQATNTHYYTKKPIWYVNEACRFCHGSRLVQYEKASMEQALPSIAMTHLHALCWQGRFICVCWQHHTLNHQCGLL